jgi:hypothetical protein
MAPSIDLFLGSISPVSLTDTLPCASEIHTMDHGLVARRAVGTTKEVQFWVQIERPMGKS